MAKFYLDWSSFSIFFSASSTQTFLFRSYSKKNIPNAEQKSYQNCYPFIYYLEHGQIYYEQASQSPIVLQPILMFYGLVHFIKACILTTDPNYPESTTVLAHGATTRKRKKQHYDFYHDEVKIQRHGLLPYMATQMFSLGNLEGEKRTMGQLLKQVPELSTLFYHLEGAPTYLPLKKKGNREFLLSKKILDHYHMTESRFLDFFDSIIHSSLIFSNTTKDEFIFTGSSNTFSKTGVAKYNLIERTFMLPINKEDFSSIPELLVHYLLLYNLSMIARYETEWWSELLKTMPNQDYPLIQSFLNSSLAKGPFLISEYLKGNFNLTDSLNNMY